MKKSLLILLALPLCLTAGCGDDDDTPISSKYTGSRSSKYSNYDSYDYYSSGKTSGSLFSSLSFPSKRISGKNLYVDVKNNGGKVIKGSLKVYIYKGNEIIANTSIYLPSGGVQPGETVVVNSYISENVSGYTNIVIQDDILLEGSSSIKRNGGNTLFSDLSFTNKRISGKNLYVNVRNNGRKTIKGCVKACIYNGSSVVTTVSLYFPSGGLAPGGTAVLDGYIHADVKHYTDIKIQVDILLD